MRFNKVLHPEIILNTRGDIFLRSFYRQYLGDTFFDKEANLWVSPNLDNDKLFASHLCLCRKWIEERGEVFHVGKDFAQALSKINRALPVDLMKTRFTAFFSFPDNTVFDEEEEVDGAYVSICPVVETPFAKSAKVKGEWAIWASYTTKSGHVGDMRLGLEPDSIDEMEQRYQTEDMRIQDGKLKPLLVTNTETRRKRAEIYRLLLNLVLYVNSIGPDLILARPVSKMKPSEKKQRARAGEIMNQCTLQVTFVSWNYNHPIEYHVESTWVDTHMRWQRCGPQNSQVKLIWVTPHERHYNKEKTDEGQ